jgi:predicted nucleotidyltransferase
VLSGSFSTLGSAGLMSAFDRPDVLPLMDGIEVHFVQKPGNCNRL